MSNLRNLTPEQTKRRTDDDRKLELLMRMYQFYTCTEIEAILKELHINKLLQVCLHFDPIEVPDLNQVTKWKEQTAKYAKKEAKKHKDVV
jgi:hypothetical protein